MLHSDNWRETYQSEAMFSLLGLQAQPAGLGVEALAQEIGSHAARTGVK
jgi:hypothetical protein